MKNKELDIYHESNFPASKAYNRAINKELEYYRIKFYSNKLKKRKDLK